MLAHTLLALLPAVALAAPGKPLVSRGYPAAAPAAQPWQPAYAAPAPVAQEHPAPAQHETWQAQPAAPAWTPAAEHAAPQPPAQSEWPKHGSGSKPVADLDSCVQVSIDSRIHRLVLFAHFIDVPSYIWWWRCKACRSSCRVSPLDLSDGSVLLTDLQFRRSRARSSSYPCPGWKRRQGDAHRYRRSVSRCLAIW